MKMTLDEAIVHAKELSESQSVCVDCREEHKQLAEWLEQLRDYKSIFEEKQETNYEHYKDGVIQSVKYNLAVVNGEPKLCGDINCDECDFKDSGECVKRVREWLNQPYKKTKYKLSQFEYDLIQTYSEYNEGYKLSKFNRLIKLKDKGYFMDVDYDTKIQDILANCEVIEDRKEVAND